jgi:aminobenzoyl-glutamate utilization protein B
MIIQKRKNKGIFFSIIMLFLTIWFFHRTIIAGTTKPGEPVSKSKSKKTLKLKKEAIKKIEEMSETLNKAALDIWEFAEIALEEHKSTELLARLMEGNGFKVQRGTGGLAVAFIATFGEGHPVIGILGEYDALPGLSQKAGLPSQQPIIEGSPGHGCGHNLFGVASAGSAIALKSIMQRHGLKGTIKFFGCPAEETVEGKIYMSSDGAFKDLDICFDWHPSKNNRVSLKTSNALNNFEVSFRGRTSHAAGDPWNGRSALDAIELLNHGINYLREHVRPTVRMHYVIPEAGKAPNIVPDYARGWYYVRGKDRQEVEEVYQRVVKIVQGAALMTDTKQQIRVNTGVYNYLKNKQVARVLHNNLKFIGPPPFTKEEQEYARKMQSYLGKKEEGMSTKIEPFTDPQGYIGGGSTDAADVSWQVPTASLNVACSPLNIPGHSWCVTSASGSSAGLRGMRTAAKILTCSGIDVLLTPSIIREAWKEFKEKTKGFTYKCAIPKGQKPRKGGFLSPRGE